MSDAERLLEALDEIKEGYPCVADIYIVYEEYVVKLVPKTEGRPKIVYRGDRQISGYFDFDDYDCSVAEFFLEVYTSMVCDGGYEGNCCNGQQAFNALCGIREFDEILDFGKPPMKREAAKRIVQEEREAKKKAKAH